MISFDCDYTRGAHPLILQRLLDTNFEQTPGYGLDAYSDYARSLILRECGLSDGCVEFLIGGTQTNATVIDALLSRYQGVLAAGTAHINVHEAGAIEAAGHKVLVLPDRDGKIAAADVQRYIDTFYSDATYPHMVAPGMVYISQPTELGTLYTLAELKALSEVCRKAGIPLYLDGARLVYALASPVCDTSLSDIAGLCSAFYIGGTKAGTLFGEAVVVPRADLIPHFFTIIKQHGALLAKGRILALQFATLFENGLYRQLGGNAVRQALRIKDAFICAGHKLMIDSYTNQQFFILPNTLIDSLKRHVSFEYWGAPSSPDSAIRIVTDWATSDADADTLIGLL